MKAKSQSRTLNRQTGVSADSLDWFYLFSFGRALTYTTDADARSFELTDLESGQIYQLRVGAININGTGELSPWVEAQTASTERAGECD